MSLQHELQAELGAAFTVDRELLGGGMSRVFVATEVALSRRIVVKVLHPELVAGVMAERFTREIQLLARLQQANIVPLLTTGHAGELPYYTMPFVDGLSLRQRLMERGPLPIAEGMSVLRDVARALAYAHEAGVVHRDIKPENVLLSGGAAVVSDFGIAKAITIAQTAPALPSNLTQVGMGIGTPAYMAPEQASGDPSLDHRADIYAFGCLAYEIFAGRPPFRETATHALIAAHMSTAPAPIRSIRTDLSPGLASLIDRCLAKAPEQRPQHARDVLEALDAVTTPTSITGGFGVGTGRRKLAIGAAGALVIAAVALIAVVLAAKGGLRDAPGASESSLAVIPFVNVDGDSAQDYLADGVSDELATALGRLPGVNLAARSAAYRFRGRRDVDVRELGQTLRVNFVVQGTMRRVADQLRISAQLIDASSGRELWSGRFDRTTRDVLRTQDDITAAIASALRERLPGLASTTPSIKPLAQGTGDADAYDLYLRGEFQLRRRQIIEAAATFEQAIRQDTSFARAYAGLGHTLNLMPYFTERSAPSVFDHVVAAANHALALDSTLAEGHMALGLAYMHAERWKEAEAQFERAIAVDPSDIQTRVQAGRFYFYRGDDERALAEWRRAQALDPFSALTTAWTGLLLAQQGNHAEALAETRRAMTYDSSAVVINYLASRVHQLAGDTARAREIADRLLPLPQWSANRAFVYGATGDRATAREIVRGIESATPRPWLSYSAAAWAHLAIGDTSAALAALERATAAREIWPSFNRVTDPMFDPIRRSARWAALIRRIGLDDVPGAIR